jgi:endonuclease YncB( thermonuclease family)
MDLRIWLANLIVWSAVTLMITLAVSILAAGAIVMAIGSSDYLYRAAIIRWMDGDTCAVEVDLGFRLALGVTVRIYGLNCAELHSQLPEERRRGQAAKEFAGSLAAPGTLVMIQSFKAGDSTEKYGRWLARITLSDGTDFTQRMIDAGHGEEYLGALPDALAK